MGIDIVPSAEHARRWKFLTCPRALTMSEEWRPGSFTKNFSWGPVSSGLVRLHEILRLGFRDEVSDVPRSTFRYRVKAAGRPDYIPINFFLFNRQIDGVDYVVADELVFQAITSDHSPRFDLLALFALNFSYAGRWAGALPYQRRPALWAHHYMRDRVYRELSWDTKRITAKDIKRFVENDRRYRAASADKLSTNLHYLYKVGHLDSGAGARIERWWVDALFLALDRLVEDRRIDGQSLPETQYGTALDRAGFHEISGRRSLEKDLATRHLIQLYRACGGRDRFSEDRVRELSEVRVGDLTWYLANDPRPRGAIHPSNPRILKSIPRACAMLAVYAGFEVIDPEEMASFDSEAFIRRHTTQALDKLRERGIRPTMSAEELMKLTRGS